MIRPAKKNDFKEIFAMVNELENFTLDKDKFKKVFRQNLADRHIYYIVAITDKKVIGFISLYVQELLHHTGKAAEIQELFVKKNYRNLGAGTKLLQYAEVLSRKIGCVSIEVASNIKRKKTHNFYQIKGGMIRSHFKYTKQL